MKTSILHLIALFLVLGFAAACGKKSEGGGSSSKNPAYNPITSGNASGESAYNNLVSWHSGSADPFIPGSHMIYLKKSFSGVITTIPKMCEKNRDIPWCVNPTGCYKYTGAGIQIGKVVMKSTDILIGNLNRYKDCDITTNGIQLYTKAGNSELASAVLGTGKHLIKSLTQQTGGIFYVYYGSYDGSNAATSYAKINTTLPSILNPVEVGTVNYNNVRTPTSSLLEFTSGN